jgi:hypothetical protein
MVLTEFEALVASSVEKSDHNNLNKVADLGPKFELQPPRKSIKSFIHTTAAFGLVM